MPYEVSMSGGSPWGFRVAGGPFSGKPTTISRITPGGKAAQANVMQGDILVAVNGFSISHLDLTTLMSVIKLTGWTLHLTLLSQEEIAKVARKRQSEANITEATDVERPSSQQPLAKEASPRAGKICETENNISEVNAEEAKVEPNTMERAVSDKFQNIKEETIEPVSSLFQDLPVAMTPCPISSNLEYPSPKPRRIKSAEPIHKDFADEVVKNVIQNETAVEFEKPAKLPDFVRRQLKSPRPEPKLKPQVHWLQNKLKITTKRPNGLKDPGYNLKLATAANPCRKIEIEGPVSATIIHSQYNTPVGIYSPTQIVDTLVKTAAATGTKIPDPGMFGDQIVDVDRNTAVYRMVHKTDKPHSSPAQSRSIKILEALLEQGKEIPRPNF